MRTMTRILIICLVALTLQACKSKNRTPIPPIGVPSTSGLPTGLPSPGSLPGAESNPGSPTGSERGSKGGSSGGDPNAPSLPGSGIPGGEGGGGQEQASTNKRDRRSDRGGAGGDGKGDSQETADAADRQKAAEQLKKSAEKVAEAANRIPDPLIPEGEYDSDVYTGDDDSGESQQAMDLPPEVAAQIEAAIEALEEAGISLEQASEKMETADDATGLAEAEVALNRARVAIIVANQELIDLAEDARGTEYEPLIDETEIMLDDANIAIVLATQTIFSSRIDLPEFENATIAGSGGQGRMKDNRTSQLEDELEESIVVFEDQIIQARAEVLGSAPPPTEGENIPGVAVLGGDSPVGMGDDTADPEAASEEDGMPPETELASVDDGTASIVPSDIPDPQGDDIVAQQLREAAMAETDPELRDKLWEEYKRYKSGL